jgi:GNAT superfamily N-acetyltransferase
VEIRRINDLAAVQAAGLLFDTPPQLEATQRFLADDRHHLLIGYVDDVPVGMVTGVELTQPDKGSEMFISSLGVAEPYQSGEVGSGLVAVLGDLARERGCSGMWVVTDNLSAAALASYRSGSVPEPGQVVLAWTLDEPTAPSGQSAPGR